jgi:hypothetical protein
MSGKNLRNLPIYKKSLELCHMSRALASYITFNKDLRNLCQSNSLRDIMADALLTDAILIPQKIAAVEFSNNPTERVAHVSFINIMIKNINSYCLGLEKDGIKEIEYINLLRKEIKSFRKYYRKWRVTLK